MLYIVATPIGNLKDITLRALDVLKSCAIIACENTRHSQILLTEYAIQKHIVNISQHSSEQQIHRLLEDVKSGKNIAYITDAGMPLVSDPGYLLVAGAVKEKVPFTVLPGPNAALTALVASGFLQKEFYFGGFLPLKKGRKKTLEGLLNLGVPVVLYESPYRMNKLLEEIVTFGHGDRNICVGRELTKMYEEYIRGTAGELSTKYAGKEWKGECTVVIG